MRLIYNTVFLCDNRASTLRACLLLGLRTYHFFSRLLQVVFANLSHRQCHYLDTCHHNRQYNHIQNNIQIASHSFPLPHRNQPVKIMACEKMMECKKMMAVEII